MMKRKYISPECVVISVRTESLLAASDLYEEIPVNPNNPGTPSVREEPKSHGSLWDQAW